MRTKPEGRVSRFGPLVGRLIAALMSPLFKPEMKIYPLHSDSQLSIVSAFLAVVFGAGTGMILCVAVNKVINQRILATCNLNLNQIIYIRTAVGDSYGCVSRAILQGPSYPIKP